MTRRKYQRRGVYRRTRRAIYAGGSWAGYNKGEITVELVCGHALVFEIPVCGNLVGAPPRGLWCRQCGAAERVAAARAARRECASERDAAPKDGAS